MLSCDECAEVVVGKTLADRMSISVSDTIQLSVNNTIVNATVVGMYGSPLQFTEISTIYIPLSFLQEVTGLRGLVSEILVKLSNPSSAQEVANTISSMYPELRANIQTMQIQQASQVLSTLTVFFLSIGLIALIAGGFGVANTMLINVFEQSREIAILRAIGAGSKIVLMIFIMESLFLGLLGSLVGIAIGLCLTYVLPNYFTLTLTGRLMPSILSRGMFTQQSTRISLVQPVITWEVLSISVALGVMVSLIAGIYPSFKASRIKPVEVLKHA